jgi:hypothetical protein
MTLQITRRTFRCPGPIESSSELFTSMIVGAVLTAVLVMHGNYDYVPGVWMLYGAAVVSAALLRAQRAGVERVLWSLNGHAARASHGALSS